jgi:hypothetical protein
VRPFGSFHHRGYFSDPVLELTHTFPNRDVPVSIVLDKSPFRDTPLYLTPNRLLKNLAVRDGPKKSR